MAQVFHIRTVNGSAIPVPKELRVAEYTVDKDSYRSASGLLIRNPITKKLKFFLTFAPMDKADIQALLTIFNSYQFVVEYEDIYDSTVKSSNFYHGDIEIKPRWIKSEDNTDVLYDEFSINLIEY